MELFTEALVRNCARQIKENDLIDIQILLQSRSLSEAWHEFLVIAISFSQFQTWRRSSAVKQCLLVWDWNITLSYSFYSSEEAIIQDFDGFSLDGRWFSKIWNLSKSYTCSYFICGNWFSSTNISKDMPPPLPVSDIMVQERMWSRWQARNNVGFCIITTHFACSFVYHPLPVIPVPDSLWGTERNCHRLRQPVCSVSFFLHECLQLF